jgi:YHS domain-containing protein
MSVCTGAFLLAATGLLDGHPATTHHSFYSQFATTFPKVQLQRGKRFVEGDGTATAGGLTSGIDLALRVVERYFGRDVAERTADLMEYHSDGWRDPTGSSNAKYAQAGAAHGVCPVCQMDLPAKPVTLVARGRTHRFCSELCRAKFAENPVAYRP